MDSTTRPLFLGIEGGGSHTVAIMADAGDNLVRRLELGPANIRLVSDADLFRLFRTIARQFSTPAALAIGLAGARAERDRQRIRAAAGHVWPGVPCHATHDLATALAAAPTPASVCVVRVLVLSGTGSCCYGRTQDGLTAKVGGWGHILGDQGSGYDVGLLAVRTVLNQYDSTGRWPRFGQDLLRALALNQPDDLIDWAQGAAKPDVAALAVEVFRAAKTRDYLAKEIISTAAIRLACMAVDCARRLVSPPEAPVEFVLAGGLLKKQPIFRRLVRQQVARMWPAALASFVVLDRESAWGAVRLARENAHRSAAMRDDRDVGEEQNLPGGDAGARSGSPHDHPRGRRGELALPPTEAAPANLGNVTTEQRNPRSQNLDRLPLKSAIRLMLDEESRANRAALAEAPRIERAIRLIVRCFRRGGRLYYVGAGTSGRLGVLDASECPPTFGTAPDLVQGIIAGGQRALWESVEGAEDNAGAGADAMQFRGVGKKDVVVGIAASGRTPFVLGALSQARAKGALTVLISFNQEIRLTPQAQPTVLILPKTGPEVLTGSTRLKAGTATKLILNLLTTLAMVKLGKVISNLMVDVHPANVKLRDRAVRILQTLTGSSAVEARQTLERNQWNLRKCLLRG